MLKKEKKQMSEFVCQMRKYCGLTQIELSKLMGTSQTKISQIERYNSVELNDYLRVIKTIITVQNKRAQIP